ncbi:MAG: ElyC/SanA/YdcF family protein [Myxococcota bacterium]
MTVALPILLFVLLPLALPLALRRRHTLTARVIRSLDALPDRARIVVLGCHVRNRAGRPNRLFTARVAAGAAAYHVLAARGEGRRARILASGHGRLGETDALREQLIAANVPADAIDLDPDGERTIRTLAFLARSPEDRPIVLVSQAFHLPRSLWLAERHGLDALGLPAAGGIGGLRARLREHLAWLRALLDVARR